MLFADDRLLFFKGNREGAEELSSLLGVYCEALGQKINKEKPHSSLLKAAFNIFTMWLNKS
jgi:hypothetical protein